MSRCSGGGRRMTGESCGQEWTGTTAVHDQRRHLTFSSQKAFELCVHKHPADLPFMRLVVRADGNEYWTTDEATLEAWRESRQAPSIAPNKEMHS
jgi:hypothetical protein